MSKLSYFLLIALLAILAIIYFFIQPGQYTSRIIVACIAIALFSFFSFLGKQQNSDLNGYWVRPSNLLFFSLLVVYYQKNADLLLGFIGPGSFYGPSYINQYVIISTMGLLAFVIGYSLKQNSFQYNSNAFIQTGNINNKPSLNFLKYAQAILFLLFLANISLGSFVSGEDYSGDGPRGLFSYIEYLFQAANFSVLIVSVNNNNDGIPNFRGFFRGIPFFSWIVMLLYMILRLFSGDRGPVITLLLFLFYSYIFYSRRQIKLPLVVLFVIVGSYGTSLLGIARKADLSSSFTSRMMSASHIFATSGRFEDAKSMLSSTQELAGSHLSFEVQVYGMKEDHDGFRYGTNQLVAALNTIPFFNGFIHKSLGLTADQTSSSYYATYKYIGRNPNWGIGTNCMGDFYMDFGLFGVVLGMLLIGVIFCWIDYKLLLVDKANISYQSLAFILVYSANSIYIPRSNFMADIKFVVFIIVLIAINNKFSGKYYHE